MYDDIYEPFQVPTADEDPVLVRIVTDNLYDPSTPQGRTRTKAEAWVLLFMIFCLLGGIITGT
jgi:hypothetical protein